MSSYIGIVYGDDRTGYGIVFPDFRGCVSAADSFAELMSMGEEALSAHVSLMRTDGDLIPEPSTLEQVREQAKGGDSGWINLDEGVVVMVPLKPLADLSRRVNITMPASLLEQIDAVTSNRSGFLAEAARQMLATPRGVQS